MSGDIGIREQVIVLPKKAPASAAASSEAALKGRGGRVMHQYGERVMLAEVPAGAETELESSVMGMMAAEPGAINIPAQDLSEAETLGLEAFALRNSAEYAQAKANRPRQGVDWDDKENGDPLVCTDIGMDEEEQALMRAESNGNAPPLSARLTGKVAVGIVIVQGPSENLKFSLAERQKVIAEVQNGLGWLGAQNPAGKVQFIYDIHTVSITQKPLTGNPSSSQKEARFRDPAMAKLGYGAGMANVSKYANDIRSKFRTNWGYVAFFTKYPVGHFAYASIGGPRIIMHYDNDGWGPDNIDRVFAHETGHIFRAPDEYAASGCNCGGSWGYYNKPNKNCATCAPGGGVKCIMKGNDWTMCAHTPYHLGFPLVQQRYSGVFRGGSGKYALWVNSGWNSFRSKWQQWSAKGMRLTDIEVLQVGNSRRYNGVFTNGTDGYGLWVNASWTSFRNKWIEWSKKKLRLVDVEIIRSGNKTLYTGVYRRGTDAYGLWANATYSSFRAKWIEWSKKNLRLVDLKITNFGGQRRYTGVFRAGSGKYGLWVNATWDSFRNKWVEWSKKGLRLVDLEVTYFGGQRRYSGVFGQGSDKYGLWVNADWVNFKEKWADWSKKGLRLTDLEVTDPANRTHAPIMEEALALGMEQDENGGEGFGGISGELPEDEREIATIGDDIDVGQLMIGEAALAPSHELTNGSEQEQEDATDGFGGMSDEVESEVAAHQHAPAAAEEESDGFGGIGDDSDLEPSGEDGFGGIGGQLAEDVADVELDGDTEDVDIGAFVSN